MKSMHFTTSFMKELLEMTSTMKHSPTKKKKKNLKSEFKNIPKFLKTFLNGNEYSSSVAQKFF